MRVVARDTLEAAVGDVIGGDVVELQNVTTTDLDYDAFLPHRDVRRITGSAVSPTGRLPWSVIEKRTGGPSVAAAYLVDNGRRELAAYRSGLLADLPAGLRAPALHGVSERSDGQIVLWLEDISQDSEGAMTQGSILGVARDLGRLAGTWFVRPSEPWFFRGWIERHAQPGAPRRRAAGLAA